MSFMVPQNEFSGGEIAWTDTDIVTIVNKSSCLSGAKGERRAG